MAVDAGSDSEDDSVVLPESVNNYWLEDGNEKPVPISELSLHPSFNGGHSDIILRGTSDIILRGTSDSGLQPVYLKVHAWKLDFGEDTKVRFFVGTKDKHWIELLKPRKIYESTIRSVLVAANFMGYVAKKPDASERAVWSHLSEVFSFFEEEPSRSDLTDHTNLIQQYMKERPEIGKSAVIQSMFSENFKEETAAEQAGWSTQDKNSSGRSKIKKQASDSDSCGDNNEGMDEDEEDEVPDLSESVCSICDNGGDVVCCDGPCMRSFHVTRTAEGAEDSSCKSLGLSKAEAAEIERMDIYFCPNCKLKIHQCYACGELGSSDESRGEAQEVFNCDAATCGHFYHPKCAAKLLAGDDEAERDAIESRIRQNEGFSCPIHKCQKCGKGEVPEDESLQFAVCRRCPRAWHRKCLPSNILFDGTDDEPQRAWEDILPNRILIYCRKHRIVDKYATPSRDHVKFPVQASSSEGKSVVKPIKKLPKAMEDFEPKKRKADSPDIKPKPLLDASKPLKAKDVEKQDMKVSAKSYIQSLQKRAEKKAEKTKVEAGNKANKSKVESSSILQSEPKRFKADISSLAPAVKRERIGTVEKKTSKDTPGKFSAFSAPKDEVSTKNSSKYATGKVSVINQSDIRQRIDTLIMESKQTMDLDGMIQKHNVPRCYKRLGRTTPDKKYTLGKIESIVKGMRRAVEFLEKGGTVEEAKVKCSDSILKILQSYKNELKVYLAPFLHGMRYTSFGRHFTKFEKLCEVVDRLHPYLRDGDTVVDMCCGSNDFSILMKERLLLSGKKCDFINFDIIQPKNDFNFTKSDWFQVKKDQLPNGSRLIIGLNPPFGVKGALANSFIDHALAFKPKLVILIVPVETEKLNCKKEPYDMIWDDPDLLKGESFYLPGSVDVNENSLTDWNTVAPPLTLWSRSDFTQRHREIALQQGHLSDDSLALPAPRFIGAPSNFRPGFALQSATQVKNNAEKVPIVVNVSASSVTPAKVLEPTSEATNSQAKKSEVKDSKVNATPLDGKNTSASVPKHSASPGGKKSGKNRPKLGMKVKPHNKPSQNQGQVEGSKKGSEDKQQQISYSSGKRPIDDGKERIDTPPAPKVETSKSNPASKGWQNLTGKDEKTKFNSSRIDVNTPNHNNSQKPKEAELEHLPGHQEKKIRLEAEGPAKEIKQKNSDILKQVPKQVITGDEHDIKRWARGNMDDHSMRRMGDAPPQVDQESSDKLISELSTHKEVDMHRESYDRGRGLYNITSQRIEDYGIRSASYQPYVHSSASNEADISYRRTDYGSGLESQRAGLYKGVQTVSGFGKGEDRFDTSSQGRDGGYRRTDLTDVGILGGASKERYGMDSVLRPGELHRPELDSSSWRQDYSSARGVLGSERDYRQRMFDIQGSTGDYNKSGTQRESLLNAEGMGVRGGQREYDFQGPGSYSQYREGAGSVNRESLNIRTASNVGIRSGEEWQRKTHEPYLPRDLNRESLPESSSYLSTQKAPSSSGHASLSRNEGWNYPPPARTNSESSSLLLHRTTDTLLPYSHLTREPPSLPQAQRELPGSYPYRSSYPASGTLPGSRGWASSNRAGWIDE